MRSSSVSPQLEAVSATGSNVSILAPAGGPGTALATALVNVSRSCARVVPLSLAHSISIPFADALRALWAARRDVTARNFSQVLGLPVGHPAVQHTTRESFRHFGRWAAESIHLQGWGNDDIADRVAIEGWDNLDQAARAGRGVIFVGAHMGSTEVAASLAVIGGFSIATVMEEVRPRWLMETALISRQRMGVTLLSPRGAGISLIRRLRRGGMVAFVVDAAVNRPDTVPVTLFGRETRFPEGPARLARFTGAPIVYGTAVRLRGGRYRAVICPPLTSDREVSAEEDIRVLTQRIATVFEGFVRQYPAQWYAFREMWPGDADSASRL